MCTVHHTANGAIKQNLLCKFLIRNLKRMRASAATNGKFSSLIKECKLRNSCYIGYAGVKKINTYGLFVGNDNFKVDAFQRSIC